MSRQPALRVLLLAAPLIFIAHFSEEAPGFVAWFNRHVQRGITAPLFWTVNYTALGITVGVVILEWLSASAVSAAVVVAWLSLLMMANALFHIAGALADRAYMPGVVTAILLYLPFWAWMIRCTLDQGRLSRRAVMAAAVVGAAPMLVHGYLIVFSGSRLF
jgi:Protein of unknown function with HXXEE motif